MHNIPMQFFFLTRLPASRIKGAAVLTKRRKIIVSVPPSGTGSWYLLLYSLVVRLSMREPLCILQSEMLTAFLLFAGAGVCFGELGGKEIWEWNDPHILQVCPPFAATKIPYILKTIWEPK